MTLPDHTITELRAQLCQAEAANVGLMAQLDQADALIEDLTWAAYFAEEAAITARYTLTDAGYDALERTGPPWA